MSAGAGRFAPSPTGPLHIGSLLAATASFLDARGRGERWLLRIDDLDTARNAEGSESAIQRTLEVHALFWDGPLQRQSEHMPGYLSALEHLESLGAVFYCRCSRKDLKGKRRYPGTCRHRTHPSADSAIRLRVPETPITFQDLIAGRQTESLAATCGDFVVRRRDGVIAYQLATAVDDGAQEIVRVVRGGDLLDNTARQVHLMTLLELSVPAYAHLPVLTNADGQKLSKQSHAPAVDDSRPSANLVRVFPVLGLRPPDDAARWSPSELLDWGARRWSLDAVNSGTVVFPV
jgi:glutamyl-Q tRNA(Asp) synthetase